MNYKPCSWTELRLMDAMDAAVWVCKFSSSVVNLRQQRLFTHSSRCSLRIWTGKLRWTPATLAITVYQCTCSVWLVWTERMILMIHQCVSVPRSVHVDPLNSIQFSDSGRTSYTFQRLAFPHPSIKNWTFPPKLQGKGSVLRIPLMVTWGQFSLATPRFGREDLHEVPGIFGPFFSFRQPPWKDRGKFYEDVLSESIKWTGTPKL